MKLHELKVLNEVKKWLSSETSILNIHSERKQKITQKEALSILNSSDPKDINIKYLEKTGKYAISVANLKDGWMKMLIRYNPSFKPESEVYIKDIKF